MHNEKVIPLKFGYIVTVVAVLHVKHTCFYFEWVKLEFLLVSHYLHLP